MFRFSTIRGRLFLGFGIQLGLIIALAGWTVLSSARVTNAVSEAGRTTAIVIGLKEALLSVRQGHAATWAYLATGDETALERRNAAFERFTGQYSEALSRIKTAHGRQVAGDFHRSVEHSLLTSDRLVDLRRRGVAAATPAFLKAVADFRTSEDNDVATNEIAARFYHDFAIEDGATADSHSHGAGRAALFAGVVAILLGIASALSISAGISGPVRAMTGAMAALAGGDLSVEIPASGARDEIGAMAKAMATFKENALHAEQLRAEQTRHQDLRESRGRRIETLTKGFNERCAGMIGAMADASKDLENTARSMTATAERTALQATTVTTSTELASAHVETVATAAGQLSASIGDIARQVSEAARISTAAAEEALRTNDMIQGLALSADRIGAIVEMINNIAGQTNLLALNAAIEAARAGETGRGFAVVANEVKSLASQTGHATDEIAAQIVTVQTEVRLAVERVRGIGQTIETVRRINSGIAASVEEQSAATREIARSVRQAAEGTHQVSQTIGGVTEAAAMTGTAAGHVLTSAAGLAKNVQQLRHAVDAFIATVKAA